MKNFYRNFLKLCSILVLQNVVTLSVNLADNIMLGAFSETALSGVTTVNQVQFVFQQLLMALGDGLVIFGSQYWGKKETEPVRKISAWAMRTGIFIALILFLLASFFPCRLLGLFISCDHPFYLLFLCSDTDFAGYAALCGNRGDRFRAFCHDSDN